MATQTTSGKAFEYAIAHSVHCLISQLGPCELIDNNAMKNAALEFSSLPETQQVELMLAAMPAVRHLLHFEPVLERHTENSSRILLSLQSDQSGGEGDVRDIVISNERDWQIGISAKHQHEAVKHSRISAKIDFGEKWIGIPCSGDYFREITPVFDSLAELKKANALWSDLQDKESTIYGVLLDAFRKELLRIDRENPGSAASALACYLIGKKDFYKVMKFQHMNKIQVFNFNGSLNSSDGRTKPRVHLDRLKLPRRIVEFDYKIDENGLKSNTTLELICDGGWQISFRIHNASSRVEPSLKFDIGLVGRPNSLPTFNVLWQ